jgi:MOSC domain-containing protein
MTTRCRRGLAGGSRCGRSMPRRPAATRIRSSTSSMRRSATGRRSRERPARSTTRPSYACRWCRPRRSARGIAARSNVLLAGDGEDALVGAHVSLGDAVIEVGRRIQRCVMTVRPQPGGIEGDLQVLRTIARERDSCLAVGALVTQPGRVSVGDTLIASPPAQDVEGQRRPTRARWISGALPARARTAACQKVRRPRAGGVSRMSGVWRLHTSGFARLGATADPSGCWRAGWPPSSGHVNRVGGWDSSRARVRRSAFQSPLEPGTSRP